MECDLCEAVAWRVGIEASCSWRGRWGAVVLDVVVVVGMAGVVSEVVFGAGEAVVAMERCVVEALGLVWGTTSQASRWRRMLRRRATMGPVSGARCGCAVEGAG